MTLRGIDSIENGPEWEQATANSFTEFYNNGPDLDNTQVVIFINNIESNGFTKMSQKRMLRPEISVEIIYTQDLFYRSRDAGSLNDEQLARYPLSKDENRESYISNLKLLDGYTDLTGVSTISDSTALVIPPDPPVKKTPVGAIVGGVFIVIIGIIAAILAYAYQRKVKNGSDPVEEVVLPSSGSGCVMSSLMDDTPARDGGHDTSSIRSPGDQSDVTFDYDYTSVAGGNFISPNSAEDVVTVDLDRAYDNVDAGVNRRGVSPVPTVRVEEVYDDLDQAFLDTLYGAPVSATLVEGDHDVVSFGHEDEDTTFLGDVHAVVRTQDAAVELSEDVMEMGDRMSSVEDSSSDSSSSFESNNEEYPHALYSPTSRLDSVIEAQYEDPSLSAASSARDDQSVSSEDSNDREYLSRGSPEEKQIPDDGAANEELLPASNAMQVSNVPEAGGKRHSSSNGSSDGSSKASKKSAADSIIETAEKAILQAQEILEKLSD